MLMLVGVFVRKFTQIGFVEEALSKIFEIEKAIDIKQIILIVIISLRKELRKLSMISCKEESSLV